MGCMFFCMFSYVFILWLLWSWCFVNALWCFVYVSFRFDNKAQLRGWSSHFFMHLICRAGTAANSKFFRLDDFVQVATEFPFDALQCPLQPVLNEQPFFETHTPSSNFHQFSTTSRVWNRWQFQQLEFIFRGAEGKRMPPDGYDLPRMGWKICHQIHELHFFTAFRWVFCWVFYLDFSSNVRKCSVPILVLCSMDATVCKHSTMFVPALEICRRHEQIRCEHPHWSTDFSMEDNGWNSWTDNSCITCEYWILLWFMAVAIILNEVPVVCETVWNKSTSALQDDESAWPRVAGYHGFWKNI